MQAGSGGHSGRIEKQLGLNLQEGGGERRAIQGHRSAENGLHLKHAWCKVQGNGQILHDIILHK